MKFQSGSPETSTPAVDLQTTSLPSDWLGLWDEKPEAELAKIEFQSARHAIERVAAEVPLADKTDLLGPLVGSSDLREAPVHRWVGYKEGFSPKLPGALLDVLVGQASELVVADCFSGVGTTAIALAEDPRVKKVLGVEYSPFALMASQVKARWRDFDPDSLARHAAELLDYREFAPSATPELSTFRNEEVFSPSTLRAVLQVKKSVLEHGGVDRDERAFFLIGLAATLEDLSGAMKDGRALRIRRGRKRRASSLAKPSEVSKYSGRVKGTVTLQWDAMISDVRQRQLEKGVPSNEVRLAAGDARDLQDVSDDEGKLFSPGCVDAFLYSPPYLNFLDYSEVYKLELWFLDLVRSQDEFRQLRLGTLRSHPSLKFPKPTGGGFDPEGSAWIAIDAVARWLEKHAARPSSGAVVRDYFADMRAVFAEQLEILRPGGVFACVVGNSTFANPRKMDPVMGQWRLPLLTDSILAATAMELGFENVRLLSARELRPRNVKLGSARESVVVGHRPKK